MLSKTNSITRSLPMAKISLTFIISMLLPFRYTFAPSFKESLRALSLTGFTDRLASSIAVYEARIRYGHTLALALFIGNGTQAMAHLSILDADSITLLVICRKLTLIPTLDPLIKMPTGGEGIYQGVPKLSTCFFIGHF